MSRHQPLPNQPAGMARPQPARAGAMLARSGQGFPRRTPAQGPRPLLWLPARKARRPSSARNTRIRFEFTPGSHAAAAPHSARSALDAAELMNVGVNSARAHAEDAHHYAISSRRIAPNVVQAKAKRIAWRGADDGDYVTSEVVKRDEQPARDTQLEDAMQRTFDGSAAAFDAEECRSQRMQKRCRRPYRSAFRRLGDCRVDFALWAMRCRQEGAGARMMGSTDVGDVSWAVPTVQAPRANLYDRHAAIPAIDARATAPADDAKAAFPHVLSGLSITMMKKEPAPSLGVLAAFRRHLGNRAQRQVDVARGVMLAVCSATKRSFAQRPCKAHLLGVTEHGAATRGRLSASKPQRPFRQGRRRPDARLTPQNAVIAARRPFLERAGGGGRRRRKQAGNQQEALFIGWPFRRCDSPFR
ncbi:hypothetical protein FQR65_LT20456 [Abscondita terminalis]|nr:hypothetical protein FQR65_LT20456 [Abscondita terminalis]